PPPASESESKAEAESEAEAEDENEVEAEAEAEAAPIPNHVPANPVILDTSYDVELADGRVVSTNTILRGCTLVGKYKSKSQSTAK
ncbi:hypothetical protein Tco_0557643, partial [Tanacetum coccineum]